MAKKKKKEPEAPKVVTETKSIKYDFSAIELHNLGQQLAKKTNERAPIEAEAKTIAKKFKTQLGEIDTEINRLAGLVESEFEYRDIKCEILYHHPVEGKKTYKRLDNGECLPSEPMEPHEFTLFNQAKLPIASSENAGDTAAQEAGEPAEVVDDNQFNIDDPTGEADNGENPLEGRTPAGNRKSYKSGGK